MKHLLLETTEHKKVTESSQHGFVKDGPGDDWLGIRFAEKDQRIPVSDQPRICQQRSLAAQKAHSTLSCSGRDTTSRSRDMTLLLLLHR